MAFVDVTVPYANVGGSGVAAGFGGGAPSGGGSPQQVPMRTAQAGAQAPGTNISHRNWIIGFYLFIAAVLVWAGVIFNPKGK